MVYLSSCLAQQPPTVLLCMRRCLSYMGIAAWLSMLQDYSMRVLNVALNPPRLGHQTAPDPTSTYTTDDYMRWIPTTTAAARQYTFVANFVGTTMLPATTLGERVVNGLLLPPTVSLLRSSDAQRCRNCNMMACLKCSAKNVVCMVHTGLYHCIIGLLSAPCSLSAVLCSGKPAVHSGCCSFLG